MMTPRRWQPASIVVPYREILGRGVGGGLRLFHESAVFASSLLTVCIPWLVVMLMTTCGLTDHGTEGDMTLAVVVLDIIFISPLR
jgi:hypothetical protein